MSNEDTPKVEEIIPGIEMETATLQPYEPETAIGKLKSRTEWQGFLLLFATLLGNAFAKHFLGVEVVDESTALGLIGTYGTYGVTVAARKFGKGSR